MERNQRDRERANLRGGRSKLGPIESYLRAEGGEVNTAMAGRLRLRLREQVLGIPMQMTYPKNEK